MRMLAVAGLISLSALGHAQAVPENSKAYADLKKYCTGDALTHCSGIDSKGPEMEACFKKNRNNLTENCRRAIDAYTDIGRK